ncbi:hypothetical protein AKAW_10287 [Aspergillus niger]|uniref:Condensation domain-containing protein n=1 Tax=Aspergillus niger TaxID=5061 RepID=A0A100IG62_ASPNG|nr:hypothetical protein AKAW_10287 [Aspergillus niger]
MTYLDFESLSGSPPSHKRGSLVTSTTEIFHPPAPAGITMTTVVRTAWALCLAHMAGTDDVVFGQPVNGRNLELPGVEAVVGAHANILDVFARSGLPGVQSNHATCIPLALLSPPCGL